MRYICAFTIEISSAQHQRLKASVTLQGKSIKDFTLDRTFLYSDEQSALQALEGFLKSRLEVAKKVIILRNQSMLFLMRSIRKIFP
jgi:hypothetical protein